MVSSNCITKYSSKRMSLFDVFLYVYVILLPIGTGLAGIIGSISLMNYFAAGIILCGMISCISRCTILVNKQIIPTFMYFFFTVISVFWSSNVSLNWYVMTNAVNFFMLIFFSTHTWTENEFDIINKCVALSQIIVICATVANISSIFSYRLSITIVSTIGTSDFACGLCLIIALWMNVATNTRKSIWRRIAFVAIALDIAIIVLAGSRGAIAMVIAMVIVWVFLGKNSLKTKLLIAFMILLILFLYENLFIDLLPSTIINRLTISAIQKTRGSGRFNIWKLAWDTFKNSSILKILFGYGFNSFLQTIRYGSHGGRIDLSAHNVFIQTMIEGGVVGLILLIRMIISQLKIAWKNNDTMMKLALSGLLVASLSIDMQVTRIWGFILMLNLARNMRGIYNE